MEIRVKFEDLIRRYETNPVIRGLVQLIPFGIGSGVEVALMTTVNNIRQDRLKTFFDELAAGSIELTPLCIESEDFLHAYFSTIKAALNTRRREKIRLFANLLKTSYTTEALNDIDEYEEFLRILDEMSYRELLILLKLYHFENEHSNEEPKNDWKRAEQFWDTFLFEMVRDLGIKEDEVFYFLQRLERTGCYETFHGFWGNDKKLGRITPSFYRLKLLIDPTNKMV
jgi:hypothetical protein